MLQPASPQPLLKLWLWGILQACLLLFLFTNQVAGQTCQIYPMSTFDDTLHWVMFS
jgi:hypothetical protein